MQDLNQMDAKNEEEKMEEKQDAEETEDKNLDELVGKIGEEEPGQVHTFDK